MPVIPLTASEQVPKSISYRSRLFNGRVNRINFIFGLVLVFIGPILMVFLMGIVGGNSSVDAVIRGILLILNLALGLVAVIIGLSLYSRRLHDLNKSDWYFLINFLPYVNILFILYLTFWPGNSVSNKYGLPPFKGLNVKNIFALP